MLSFLGTHFFTPLYDVAGIRSREQASFAHEGDSFPMMQRAGQAFYHHILRRQRGLSRIAIVVGGGNNGGDGWVIAALAAQDGLHVAVYDASSSPRKGDALQAERNALQYEKIEVKSLADLAEEGAPVLVDALLGIGFRAPLSEGYQQAIVAMNTLSKAGAWLACVDCPSGLDLHTGKAELAVRGDLVVTFIGDKMGHYLQDGPTFCHEIVTENLQAVDLFEQPKAYFLSPAALDEFPPCRRTPNSHKGSYGHVTVVGGDHGYGGAAIMASEASAKSGAGTVCVYTQERHLMASLVRNPNIMAINALESSLASTMRGPKSVVVIGPGLGRSEWSERLWQQFRTLPNCLSVVDADGLYWLTQQPTVNSKMILTPHPGEAAMLLAKKTEDILQDVPGAAQAIALRYGAVVILKGATSVVASPDGRLMVVGKPCSGLAKGGSGDVLSGMAGSCLAYYDDPFDAAVMAAAWHNKAAKQCEQHLGMVSMQPYQLLDYLER